MINEPRSSLRLGLALATDLTLIQHNSLRSWDVFLSLFSSLTEGPPPDLVLLQDPPSSKAFLPSVSGFKSLAPPHRQAQSSLLHIPELPAEVLSATFCSPETDDFMTLDVFTPQSCFGTNSPHFTIGNAYARPHPPFRHSVSPESSLPNLNHPYLVAGNFNIYNTATDPFRVLPSREEKEYAPYLD